jgi:hypothetical protein
MKGRVRTAHLSLHDLRNGARCAPYMGIAGLAGGAQACAVGDDAMKGRVRTAHLSRYATSNGARCAPYIQSEARS